MSYDKKSNIGQFKSNANEPNLHQLEIYNQRLIQEERSLDKQVEIELLDMGMFGCNTNVNRKNIGILEAESVSLTEDYGVMQVEKEVIFEQGEGELVKTPWFVDYEYIYKDISYNFFNTGNSNNASLITQNNRIYAHSSEESYIPSQICSIVDKNIYGLWWIGNVSGIGTQQGESDISLLDGFFGSMNNGYMDTAIRINVGEGIGGYKIYELEFNITIYDPSFEVTITIEYWETTSRLRRLVSKVFKYGQNVPLVISTDGGFKAQSEHGHAKHILLTIDTNKGGHFYQDEDTCTKDYTGDKWRNLKKFPLLLSGDYWSLPPSIQMPECDIFIKASCEHKGGISIKTGTVILRNKGGINVFKRSLYSETQGLFDWTYFDYIRAKRVVGEARIDCLTIGGEISEDVLIGLNFDSLLPLAKEEIKYNYEPEKFFLLNKVNENISIGIFKRRNNLFQIGVKFKGIYVLGRNNKPVSINALKIDSLRVLEYSNDSLTFIIGKGNKAKIYMLSDLSVTTSGKLLASKNNMSIPLLDVYEKEYSVDEKNVSFKSDIGNNIGGTLYGVNKYLYKKISNNIDIRLSHRESDGKRYPSSCKAIVSTNDGLDTIVYNFTKGGSFVQECTSIYLPSMVPMNYYFYYSGNQKVVDISSASIRNYVSIIIPPSFDETTNNFVSLPLRTEDEYPEIYYNTEVGDNFFMLGKAGFTSVSGTLYQSGGCLLTPDIKNPYITKIDSDIYGVSNLIFVSTNKVTYVYTFSELGFEIIHTIEDKLITTPLKITAGILAGGTKGLWLVTNDGVVKLYKTGLAEEAILRHDFGDNATYVLRSSVPGLTSLATGDGEKLSTNDQAILTISGKDIQIISITSDVKVSSRYITELDSYGTMIRTQDANNLLFLPSVSNGIVYKLVEKDNTLSSFTISSTQNILMEGTPLSGRISQISIFAKGNGTVTINDRNSIETISIDSGKFKRYRVGVNNDIDMFSYTITCSSGVKLLQRIIGIVTYEEVYDG